MMLVTNVLVVPRKRRRRESTRTSMTVPYQKGADTYFKGD